ncbi:LppU/SCO3897 family protein [Streptomyces lasiicapitis]|uniref:LppU/SCO3897 family protein n=1 Tax=Streptomyces lasiicapitis TaxID=1923961 RepID=UPI003655F88E
MSTPPPQGQNPFAQGQQPYGQQPQGGAPYGQPQGGGDPYSQAPGQPYPPQPGAPQQPGVPFYQGGPDATAPRKSKKKLIFVIVGVAVAAAIGAAVWAGQDEAAAAEVGDCMSIGNPASTTDPDLKIVDCGDKDAKYKVAEKKDSGTCDIKKYATYRETGGGDDFTLCLEPYKP